MVKLQLSDISKTFNRRVIFSGLSLSLENTASLTVTGKNGSGKSTLMKIIAGVLSPTRGTVGISADGKTLHRADHYTLFGFVSPYLQLYDEFTGFENLDLTLHIRGLRRQRDHIKEALDRVGLGDRGSDLLRTYSSGMKQRLKFAAAIIHHPQILLLDEPTSNLDESGKEIVHGIIREQREHGLLIVATNESDELGFCDQILRLDPQTGWRIEQ